jgi:alpha-D-xyloside xylohydrolase
MQLDSRAFLRLDALTSLGTSASGAAFATSTGDILEVTCHGAGTFRLRAGPNTRPEYGLVVGRAERCEVAQPELGVWSFTIGDTQLQLRGAPLSIRLFHGDQQVLTSISDEAVHGGTSLPVIGRARNGKQWIAAFALLSGEPVYGLGEKFGPLNKRGQLVHSQVEDAQGINTGLSSKNVPFCWSPGTGAAKGGAWGIFTHTPGRVTHGVGYPDWSHRTYGVVVDDEALDLFLLTGADPAHVIDRYTTLTGRAADVPLWGLGLWVARASYRTADEAMQVAEELREHKIPCDVLTLDGNSAWEVQTQFDFRWDEKRYPDPATTLKRIKRHALRICVWEYPCVSIHSPLFQELAAKRFLLTNATGEPCIVGWENTPGSAQRPESGLLDFTNPAAYEWWRDAHEALFAAGVDVIKSDFGEQVPADAVAFNGDQGQRLHNVYPLLYNRCVHEATAKFAPAAAGPPMVWGRAGWTGSQRYPVQCGGDAQSDWEGLAAGIRGGLSYGMSGVPYYATDIGGSYGQAQPSAELYLRWLQMSVFSSHMRLYGTSAREPWTFGAEVAAIARQWIEFRYRLLPYLQRAIAQAVATGLPVMRAMALAFPGNALTRSYETQFMCGDALLVAPILAAGGEVEVALPPGAWYDLASRQRLAGRQVIRYRATLDRFPVFGREGHALLLGPVVQHTGELDRAKPVDALWLFGKPTHSLEGFAQAAITIADGHASVEATPEVAVEVFGDPAGIEIKVRSSAGA